MNDFEHNFPPHDDERQFNTGQFLGGFFQGLFPGNPYGGYPNYPGYPGPGGYPGGPMPEFPGEPFPGQPGAGFPVSQEAALLVAHQAVLPLPLHRKNHNISLKLLTPDLSADVCTATRIFG
ncbi:hypothetical protein JNUCC1_02164 [Lentibacillus sp. JNUCC-1]|nr:hypothetical protein [Lentibacillus sp. JNUCC-1]